MTERQRYELVRTTPAFELRRYPEHQLAEVTLLGSFENAASEAFNPLVSFIRGKNAEHASLAMTAPVIQHRVGAGDGIEQGDVTETSRGRYVVAFVLPDHPDGEAAPTPDDTQVTVRTAPEQLAAVTRFSGRWTASAFGAQAQALREAVGAAGLEVVGPARFARFDPPWTPWFMRHNEVVLAVRES